MANLTDIEQIDELFAKGKSDEARDLLKSFCQANLSNLNQWLRLAIVEEQLGTKDSTQQAYQHCLSVGSNSPQVLLFAGMFFLNTDKKDKGLALLSLGFDIDNGMIYWFQNESLEEALRARSYYAGLALRNHYTELSQIKLKQSSLCNGALWPQTHNEKWQYLTEKQKPHLFYLPKLKAQPVWPNTAFAWVDVFKENLAQLMSEFQQITQDIEAQGMPYVDEKFADKNFEKLAGSKNWTALHLYQNGVPNQPIIERLPKLHELLMEVDLYGLNEHPYEVFFSLLKAGQHIVPHYGLSNHSLTVHVPFVVGDSGCLTVDNQHVSWQVGEAIVFDDSFIHEAENTSKKDRIVLIFSIWHPDLTLDEQRAIQQSFNARQSWLDERTNYLIN